MKENKIVITINKPAFEVFRFTINPYNTPLWIDSIKYEETNKFPVQIGTTYKNHGESKIWEEYVVTRCTENEFFELTSKDGIYHVNYAYRSLSENLTEIEYFEWVDSGELTNPFDIKTLEKLKELLENN